jgi:hypothetical protein
MRATCYSHLTRIDLITLYELPLQSLLKATNSLRNSKTGPGYSTRLVVRDKDSCVSEATRETVSLHEISLLSRSPDQTLSDSLLLKLQRNFCLEEMNFAVIN